MLVMSVHSISILRVIMDCNHGFGFGHWFKYHDQLLNDLGTWLKNINKK